ncbi:MAG: MBOAT family protein [Candidatus Electrothrix sp. Rat3]|nr:MBOAT family protein [Candidatus Electrothrix rattekaaiensis]
MLFNSPVYLFLFLPCTVFVYFLLNRFRFAQAATAWLVLASLFFYRYWNASYLLILITSILVNFALGTMLRKTGKKSNPAKRYRVAHKTVLFTGVFFNIALLGYYKYTDFFFENANQLLHTSLTLPHLALPLAISFFTFQQIAYLVDCSKKNAEEYDFLSYCLFVSFFPQLIAGPIVHHQEMMPQFRRLRNRVFSSPNAALGLFFFSLGFFKKVWIADQFAAWASKGFATETALTLFDAWGTSLSYTFQLYFDFSGYTDMAIGSALFFNIVLPINFNSPYQATSIQDFWRRWHMTLSRWLRDYLYIPLGGNRKGELRTYCHLFITFFLAGLWHGAGWTFVLWGGLHGAALILHRLWKKIGLRIPAIFGWLFTFLFVNTTWVIFRATNLQQGFQVLKGMVGANGVTTEASVQKVFQRIEVVQPYLAKLSGTLVLPGQMYWFLLFFSLVLFLLPNSCQIAGMVRKEKKEYIASSKIGVLQLAVMKTTDFLLSFRPNCYWALLSGILFSMALYRLLRVEPTEFLYFNF